MTPCEKSVQVCDRANRKLHIIIGSYKPQNEADGNVQSPTRVTHHLRCGKLIFIPMSLQPATAAASTFFTHSDSRYR